MAISQLNCAHLIITGRVQGVSFRFYAQNKAQSLGLTGWVKNLPNNQVEAIFQGFKDKIEDMITWCQQGSPSSKVTDLSIEWIKPSNLDSFSIQY